ncbi:threonylcarbamoyl-AMP synthase [Candidatus Micrarchaeota archaeon]|nr:threonylcarbamoyl-AMP synthase [Candidatus Micrarchaeota archaeon]
MQGNEKIEEAVKILKKGGIIVYPTDTLYGIGGNALDESVVNRIYQIKDRTRKKALSVLMKDIKMIKKYCFVNKKQEAVLKKHLPGPFTFLLRAKEKISATENDRLGVRIPDFWITKKIMEKIRFPLITTSANISGRKDPHNSSDVSIKILGKVDYFVDWGPTKYRGPSTVVDLVSDKLVRKGVGEYE